MNTETKPRSLDGLTTLDQWLDEEGVNEEVTLKAIKRVIAFQLDMEMRMKRITKTEMARRMKTSRSQVERVLNPESDVGIETLSRAAKVMGRSLRLELA